MREILLFVTVFGVLNGNVYSQDSISIESVVSRAALHYMNSPSRIGLSVGVYWKGELFTSHFGTTERERQLTPSDSTLYEIGSITKTITGVLLAKAVVDKKVSLHDDVRKYLDGHYPNLEYRGHPVRLSHLLNHSSGLPRMLPDKPHLFENPDYDSLPFVLTSIERGYSKQQFFEDLREVTIDTIPGIKLRYSNAAAQLLGYILEHVYKMSYEELVLTWISRPLNMPDTKLFITKEDEKNLARGYNGNGLLMPRTASGAAGGIYSTIKDMLNYCRFQLDESNPVVKLSHQPTWGDIRFYANGLNWHMEARDGQPPKIFQSGGTAGFSSFMIIYPGLDIGIVLLSNVSDQHSQGQLSQVAQNISASILR